MISRDDLLTEIDDLRAGEQKLLADLAATRGAIQECERLIARIDDAEKPKSE